MAMHVHGYVRDTEEVIQTGHINLGRRVIRNNEEAWIQYVCYNLFILSEI